MKELQHKRFVNQNFDRFLLSYVPVGHSVCDTEEGMGRHENGHVATLVPGWVNVTVHC